MNLFSELKRRNVIRVAVAYAVASWLLIQVLEIATDTFEAPVWVLKMVMTLVAAGLIPTLIFSWAYELTPEGLKREKEVTSDESVTAHTAKKLDMAVIALLVLAMALFAADRVLLPKGQLAEQAQTASQVPGVEQTLPGSSAQSVPVDTEENVAPANSIAVLPFANRSSQADTQFFVDGVHDDLLTQLARIGELKVISRTSVMEYRDTTKNLRQIGQELGVATLLEGAVQRSGNRVRINAQLIDANTDEHLWANTFDRELSPENIFEIQSDIAGAIARALASTLSEEEIAVSKVAAPTQNLDAYDLYLRARAIPSDAPLEETRRAIELSKKAAQLDSNFALAIGEVGHNYTNAYWFTTKDEKDRDEGGRWLERALALAPDDPQLNLHWADYLYHGYLDYSGALEALAKAQRVTPNDARIYSLRSWILRRDDDYQGAIREMEKAIQLDPRDFQTMAHHILTFVLVNDFENAQRWAQRVLSFPAASPLHLFLTVTPKLYMRGEVGPARALIEKHKNDSFGVFESAKIELPFFERRYDDVLAALDRLPDPLIDQDTVWPHSFVRARVHAAKGEMEAAQALARQSIADINKLMVVRGESGRLLKARAFMFSMLGNREMAEADLETGLSLDLVRLDSLARVGMLAQSLHVRALYMSSDELAEELGKYLTLPIKSSYIDYLFLDPVFDRHREHPAIKALEEKYSRRNKST